MNKYFIKGDKQGMRKAKHLVVLISLILVFGLLVSCSNEARVEESTATVSFGKIDGERALSSSVGIPGAEDLYWKVTATKKDSGLNRGSGEHGLGENGSKGISNNVKIVLSLGQWEFTLSGYTDEAMTAESKIYEGKKTETLYKNDSKNINVEVAFCGGTSGSGNVKLSDVILSNASTSVADKLFVEVFNADDEMVSEKLVTSTTFTKDTNNKFSGDILPGTTTAGLTPGVYKFRFTLQKDDMSAVTSLTRYVVVLQGRTTTITGDLAEDQVNISFSVTILEDEYSQFGKYFYVLVNTESAYQKALQKAAEYKGEEAAVVILSNDLTVDTTVISNSSSRAINIGMVSSRIIIDLNGHELRLKDGSSSNVLISLDAQNKTITIMDSSSNGTINATNSIAFDIKNGKLDIQGGRVNASVIINIGSNDASISVTGGTLNATESLITKTEDAQNANIDIGGADIIAGASALGFASGSGTEADPYIISNSEELKAFSNCVNQGMTFENQFVKLSGDIDLKNSPWTPIGGPKKSMLDRYAENSSLLYSFKEDDYNTFAGSFDGGYHKISNLKIENASVITNGLFGVVANGAVIKDLTVENADVAGSFFVGTLVGYIPSETSTPSEYTIIENVKIKGDVTVKGYFSFGGMIGRSEVKSLLKIVDSSIEASETSKVEVTSDGFMVGGLIGVSYGLDTVIDSCSSNIDVIGKIQSVGGFVGHMQDGEIVSSTVSGDVTLNGKNTSWPYDHYGVGAFVGTVDSTAVAGKDTAPAKKNNSILIKNCVASGNVTADVNEENPLFFNGLVGTIRNTTSDASYIEVSPKNIVSIVLEKEITTQVGLEELNLNTHVYSDRFMNGTSSIILNLNSDVTLNVNDSFFQFGGPWTDIVEIRGNGHRIDLATNYWSRLSMKNGDGKLVIKDAVMDSNQEESTWNSYDILFRDIKDLELTNVTFERAVAIDNINNAVLDNVKIIEEDKPYYALWITAGSGVTIRNSEIRETLNTGELGRGIKISDQYVGNNDSSTNPPYGVKKTTLTISDSIIEGKKKSAVLVGTVGGADITMTNVTAIVGTSWDTDKLRYVTVDNGEAEGSRGSYSNYSNSINVVIDNKTVTPLIEP